MWSLPDVRKDVRDGKRYHTRAGHRTLHGESFARSGHAVGENRAMVAFHHSTDKSFRSRIVDLGIVVVCGKDVVVVIIPTLLATISDEGSSAINHPFSLRLIVGLGGRIWTYADADNDIAFDLLSSGISFRIRSSFIQVLGSPSGIFITFFDRGRGRRV